MHPIIIMLQVTMTSCHQIVLYNNIKNILCVKVRGKKEEEQHTIILNNTIKPFFYSHSPII
jgi:hypothetical protein